MIRRRQSWRVFLRSIFLVVIKFLEGGKHDCSATFDLNERGVGLLRLLVLVLLIKLTDVGIEHRIWRHI